MKFSTNCEIVSAVHQTQYVDGPYHQRGGLWYVAPSGHLKTTAVEMIEEYDKFLLLSNLTVKSLNSMRGVFLAGNIKTIGISDLEQIYRRHSSVSAQIEGIIMSLVEEGYRNPAFNDQRIQAIPARCAVIGGMTTTFFEKMQEGWLDNGFYRRFLWSRYILDDSELLMDAISSWVKADLTNNNNIVTYTRPANRHIPMNLTKEEIDQIRHTLRFQHDAKTPLVLAMKIVSVLKWKYPANNKYMNIWLDFAESLTKDGATLEIPTALVKSIQTRRLNASSNHSK